MNANRTTRVIKALIASGAWQATLFLSPTEIIRVTRRLYRGRRAWDNKRLEFHLTVGKPNYREREFVKQLRRAHEPFPVKKIQLRYHSARGGAPAAGGNS